MGLVVSSDEAAAQRIPAARDASRLSRASPAYVRPRTRSTDARLPCTGPRARARADTGVTATYFRASLGGPWCPPPRAPKPPKMRHRDLARDVYLVRQFRSPRAPRRSGRVAACLRPKLQHLFSCFCLCCRKRPSFWPRRPRSARSNHDISTRRRGRFMRAPRPPCLVAARSRAASLRPATVVHEWAFVSRPRPRWH